MKSGCQDAISSCVKPGSGQIGRRCGCSRRRRRCARARRRSSRSRASSAAPTSELIPEPTKTASKVAIARCYRIGSALTCHRRCATNRAHASTRGRVRASGNRRGGDLPPLRARWGTCPRRRPDARQRDEGPGRLARRARRSRRSGRAADDRRSRPTACSRSARWSRTRSSIGSSEVEVARPILAEVAATIADVQVRNRGTIGGNVCVNDPTNHFPPLLAALGATFTIRGTAGERTVVGRRVLPRRLHDGGRRGRAADDDLGARPASRARATRWRASRSARTAPTS